MGAGDGVLSKEHQGLGKTVAAEYVRLTSWHPRQEPLLMILLRLQIMVSGWHLSRLGGKTRFACKAGPGQEVGVIPGQRQEAVSSGG